MRTIEERFWERVAKSEGCWLWTGPDSGNGYGLIGKGGRGGGVKYVHRLSYEIHFGEIPPKMQVCHTCDVRSCVNTVSVVDSCLFHTDFNPPSSPLAVCGGRNWLLISSRNCGA